MGEKKNTKAVSNEEIIAALLNNGTVKEAAAAVGVNPKTIYNRMDDREFDAEYAAAKADIIRQAVFSINSKLSDAVNAIVGIMNDSSVNPAVRLQAAQTVLNHAGKFAERLEIDERKAAGKRAKPSIFDGLFE